MSAPAKVDWTSLEDVRAFIANQRIGQLADALDVDDPAHLRTLFALDDDERKLLARNPRMLPLFGELALRLYEEEKRFEDALKLFDAAVDAPEEDLDILCNAVWAVANYNHHLGVMKDRARRYLDVALPYGPKSPLIYHNGACVELELGNRQAAIELARQAVRTGHDELEELRTDESLVPLHDDPQFVAAFSDPELLAERRERVLPKALAALFALQGKRGIKGSEIDFEIYERFEPPEEAERWMKAWTGNSEARSDEVRIFGQDGTGGMAALWRRDRSKPLEGDPVVFFGSEGSLGVVSKDLADFFVLFAAGIGPMEAVEWRPQEGKPLDAVGDILRKSFPASASRTAKDVNADATPSLPDFVPRIRAICKDR
jgi:hypothetical protein